MRFGYALVLSSLLCSPAFSSPPDDREIEDLLKTHSRRPLLERIEQYSEALLGRPSGNGPLGEGPDAKYDRDPLYRMDTFDCTTYVETVVALSLSNDLGTFQSRMNQIRYKEGIISFTARNHFPDLDWFPNNPGIFSDLAPEIAGKEVTAEADITKPGWYAKLGADRIVRPDLSPDQQKELLLELRLEGAKFPAKEKGKISYIPLTLLFPNGEADPAVFAKIPSGSVISVVRPNWDLVAGGGTHMNVSHQGMGIVKDGVIHYRHATTSGEKKVIDVALAVYLKPYLTSPTIRGISVYAVRDQEGK